MQVPSRRSFLIKLAAVAAVAVAADWLGFWQGKGGWTFGLFALAWVAAALLALPALRRSRSGLASLALAAAFALLMIESPSLLAWLLFWTTMSLATLLPRRGFDDAARWGLRLFCHAATALPVILVDVTRLARIRRRRRPSRRDWAGGARAMVVPVVGSAVFLLLFAAANPIISRTLSDFSLPAPNFYTVVRLAICFLAAVAVWNSLRPLKIVTRLAPDGERAAVRNPVLPVLSVLLSLLAFNLVFALQNGLDLAFLWSGAPLPPDITLADYAHRGAYPLIATALLAGLFVLLTLSPGSAAAASPAIRRLVVLWVAQNVLLVASSILRTLDYIEAYSLTVLRISALLWMGLVAVGLALICLRMLMNKSQAWLINGNALAALAVMSAAATADLGATAAWWNVRHGREVDGTGAATDLCYLQDLGTPALLPLIELEQQALEPAFRDRVRAVRASTMESVGRQLASDFWTWRGARRHAAAVEALGPNPAEAAHAPFGRLCNGIPFEPPPPPPPSPPPLPPMPQQQPPVPVTSGASATPATPAPAIPSAPVATPSAAKEDRPARALTNGRER